MATALLLPLWAAGTASAATAPASGCMHASAVYRGSPPWSLARLDPTRIWPLSTGRGIVVAVVSTGVDAANGQFRPGGVLPGKDVLAGRGNAITDCDGRGTFAAGLIAAQPDGRTPVVGLAPEATILPVRATQWLSDGQPAGGPDTVAAGVAWAHSQGAQVICVTVAVPQDSARLRGAVHSAVRGGAIVISAGQAADGGASYPSAYPDVLAVGGIDGSDSVVKASDQGAYVDIAAPATRLWSTGAGGPAKQLAQAYRDEAPATSAAYVCAVAALIRSAYPALTPAQVIQRILITADPTPRGRPDPLIGVGVVNAYRAVAAVLPQQERVATAPAGAVRPARDTGLLAPGTGDRATVVAAGGTLGAVSIVGLAFGIRRGRARGWRPERRRAPSATPSDNVG